MQAMVETGIEGVRYHPAYFDVAAQRALMAEVAGIAAAAPFFTPRMPRTGKAFSVEMTNCGPLGWVSDQASYRYQPQHPETGAPWPPMPDALLALWDDVAAVGAPAEACLINRYAAGAKMGLHQDRDEAEFGAPVVSVSLGDTAVFRLGGTTRGGKTTSMRLNSGDVIVFGGPARLIYHGIDRVLAGSSTLIPDGGRYNLTLRRVTALTPP